jgi:hypothetical protein
MKIVTVGVSHGSLKKNVALYSREVQLLKVNIAFKAYLASNMAGCVPV